MSVNYADGLSDYDQKGVCGIPEVFDETETVERSIKQLATWIREASCVVIHCGAGISTAAGIPDFRGPRGVWTKEKNGTLDKKEEMVRFEDAKPTITHMALVTLLRKKRIHFIISQNVDGLFLKTGIRRTEIAELHGNFFLSQCTKCRQCYIRQTASETMGQKISDIPCPKSISVVPENSDAKPEMPSDEPTIKSESQSDQLDPEAQPTAEDDEKPTHKSDPTPESQPDLTPDEGGDSPPPFKVLRGGRGRPVRIKREPPAVKSGKSRKSDDERNVLGCPGRLKDTILDWEDNLPPVEMRISERYARRADLAICLGTTMQINPAGNLPFSNRNGRKVAIVNLQPTKKDKLADLVIHDYVDRVMVGMCRELGITIDEYDPARDLTKTCAHLQVAWTRK